MAEEATTINSDLTRKTEGGCFCGAVRFELSGEPLGSMICHCQSCRRISGAPVVAWITFNSDDFRLICGDPREFASSPGVLRTFCTACGTPITYRNAKTPDEIDLTTCTLDDPNIFPPTHHSWLSDDVHWVKFGDQLPTYLKSRYAS